jgi:Ser/Thr protein kinase RdoA (MazF antagonist)
VLVSSPGVVLLDLDAAGMGNPLLDVGAFLAQLSTRHADSARAAFLESYSRASGLALAGLPAFEAAALLRIAVKPFRQLEADWPDEVDRRIELAADRLSQGRTSHPSVSSVADARLPQLGLLQDPAAVGRELEQLLREGPVAVVQATVVRHKPGRRCLLRYEVRVGSNAAARDEVLYGKVFASRRGAQVYERLRAVSSAAACGPGVAVPEPVGYVAALKLLVLRAVPGEPARALLLAGEASTAVRIAEAIHSLHGSGVPFDRRHRLHDEVASLPERVERIAESSELLAGPAQRCLELVNRLAERQWPWRWHPVHRDFYHDQVLVGEHGLSVLDFDDAAMSEPALDVANFMAHLRLLGFQEGESDALAASASAFESRYRELDPRLDPALVRFLEGATLLRLADIHLPRPRGQWLAERLLQHSELLLQP